MKRQTLNIFFFFATLLLCFSVWHLATAYAQSLSLNITPPLLEVTIQPGKTITQVYKISNDGDSDLTLTSSILSFEPADEKGNVQLISNLKPPFLSWFSFLNANLGLDDKFILKAGQTQEVVLRIKVPKESLEDDHYATLLFETIPGTLINSQTHTQAQAKIGANILLSVSKTGEPPKKGKIEEFSLYSSLISFNKVKIIDSLDQPLFLIRFRNTGRVFFKPRGSIILTGWSSQKYTLDLLPENVLSNSVRQLRCEEQKTIIPCQIKEKFLLGSYTASLEIGPDKPTGEYQTTTTFIAIPFKLILSLTIIILVFSIIRKKLKTV